MRLLHRDVEFDLSSKRTSNLQIQISVLSYLLYTVPFTRNYERPIFFVYSFFATRITAKRALLCHKFYDKKTCSEIKRLR